MNTPETLPTSQRTRPWGLTAFIVLGFAVGTLVVGINLLAAAKTLLNGQHDALPMMLFVVALGAARLAALVATWRWKRWGIYLWFVCAAIGAYIYASYATNPGLAFLTVIGAVVFFLCFWSRWDEFE